MATSTTFPSTQNQLWMASNGTSELCFADLEGLKRTIGGWYPGTQIEWEENGGETTKGGEPAPPLPGVSYPCSTLNECTFSHWFGGQYVAQVWADTGWRAWRER